MTGPMSFSSSLRCRTSHKPCLARARTALLLIVRSQTRQRDLMVEGKTASKQALSKNSCTTLRQFLRTIMLTKKIKMINTLISMRETRESAFLIGQPDQMRP